MIIYTPRYANYDNNCMMAEEPCCGRSCYTSRRPRTVRVRRQDPVDNLFRSMFEMTPFREERPQRRVRRSPFDSLFNDDFFGGNIFDSFFPTLRRTDDRSEQTEENKENTDPNSDGEIVDEKDEATTEEAPIESKVYSRAFTETVTRGEDGNIKRIRKEKINNNGKVKEIEKKIVENEEGEIKEEEYLLNGEKVDKMALESGSGSEEVEDEDDDWVIKPIENVEN